jgi:hypothetical protein
LLPQGREHRRQLNNNSAAILGRRSVITQQSFLQGGTTMDVRTRTRGEAEDRFSGAIESQTSRIPSSGYLAAAVSSMAASAVLKILGRDDWALFVGQWAPAFLIMGVYNKMVKQHGSDAYSRAA